jgi:hypothetical protein
MVREAESDSTMPKTRRVFDMIETLAADPDLVRDLLVSRSTLDAGMAYTSLRGVIPDGALLMLANLREVIAEIPETPFLTGHAIEVLALTADYERCDDSYRRLFETERGGFTLEFIGQGTECEAIVVHAGACRFDVAGDMDYTLDSDVLDVAFEHRCVVDEILRALQALGVPLDPRVYVTPDDFTAENAGSAASEMFSGLF